MKRQLLLAATLYAVAIGCETPPASEVRHVESEVGMVPQELAVTLEETVRPVPHFAGGFSVPRGGTSLVLRSDEPTGKARYVHTVWDYMTRRAGGSVREREQYLPAAALSADGKLMAFGYGMLTIVKLPSGEVYGRVFEPHEDRMVRPVFHPDNARILCTSSSEIHIFHLAHLEGFHTKEPYRVFYGHHGAHRPLHVTLSSDGRLALSGDGRGAAIVWEVDTLQIVQRLPRALQRRYLPPRGPVTFGLSDAPAVPDEEPQPSPLQPGVDIWALAFFPDDSKVVVAEYEYAGVSVYDVSTGRRLARYEVADKNERANSLAVTPDGRYIVIGTWTPVVWDWQHNRVVAKLVGHRETDRTGQKSPEQMPHGGCVSVTVTTDGKRIITGGIDGTLRFWRLNQATDDGGKSEVRSH